MAIGYYDPFDDHNEAKSSGAMSHPTEFEWDVFLSHAQAVKELVRNMARRLTSDSVNGAGTGRGKKAH